GIPVQQLTADERMLLVGLEERLKERVLLDNLDGSRISGYGSVCGAQLS
ncbi:hypothetical protein Tco_0719783, partial [Tanacetum coccineum]